MRKGAIHLHGHCHSNYWPTTKYFISDIGVDVPFASYAPVELDEVIEAHGWDPDKYKHNKDKGKRTGLPVGETTGD